MNFLKFSIYTFLGSFLWCLGLTFIGQKLGEHWYIISHYFRKGDVVIGVLIVLAIVLFIYRHIRRR